MTKAEMEYCRDLLADVYWWLKGYREAEPGIDVDNKHLIAIDNARKFILDEGVDGLNKLEEKLSEEKIKNIVYSYSGSCENWSKYVSDAIFKCVNTKGE